jgi:hypothetical protein
VIARWALSSLLLVGGVFGAACFDASVPIEDGVPRVSCASTDECPPRWICRTNVGLCVDPNASVGDPPALVGSPTPSPALARAGTAVSLQLEVDTHLNEPPRVAAVIEGARHELVLDPERTDASARRYDYRYVATGQEPEGAARVEVDLVSVTGVEATALPAGTLTFDHTAPRLLSSTSSPSAARAQDELTVRVVFDEALLDAPTVWLDTDAAPSFSVSADEEGYVATYRLAGDEPEGALTVLAQASDLAGNQSPESIAGIVTLDFSAPALSGSPIVAPALARAGQNVSVEVSLSEPVDTDAVLRAPSASGLDFEPVAGGTLVRRFLSVVPAGLADGSYDLTLDVTDLAGNAASLQVGAVVVDSTPPVIERVSIASGTRYSGQDAYDDVALSFDVTDDAPAPDVSVDVAALRVPCTPTVVDATRTRYECAATLSSSLPEGGALLLVSAEDAAGNRTTETTPIVIDRSAPDVVQGTTSLLLDPRPGSPLNVVDAAAPGARVRLAFLLDEPPANGTVDVELTSGGTTVSLAEVAVNASLVVASWTATGSLPDGPATFSVTASDDVGNTATRVLGAGAELTIDSTPPPAPLVDVADNIILRRSPWGHSQTNWKPTLSLRVAPGALPGAVAVRATTEDEGFVLADYVLPVAVMPLDVSLGGLDASVVKVRAVDSAGNLSSSSVVRDVQWHASFAGKVVGSTLANPHVARRVEALSPSLETFRSGNEVGSKWQAREATGEFVGGAAFYVQGQAIGTPEPSIINAQNAQLVYNPHRGRVQLLQPRVFTGVTYEARLWEWDGAVWELIEISDPEQDGGPGASAANQVLAFHRGLGRTLNLSYATVWSFTGVSWSRTFTPIAPDSPAMPTFNAGAATVWDPIARELVVQNGVTTAAFDGSLWRVVEHAGYAPVNAAVSFADDDEVVIAFGGFVANDGVTAQTARWTGDGWQVMAIPDDVGDGDPVARQGAGLAWMPGKDVLVLFGGTDENDQPLDDVWELRADGWTPIVDADPAGGAPVGSANTSIVWDPLSESLLHVDPAGQTWSWNGATWTRRASASIDDTPGAITGAATAFAPDLGGVMLFGGRDSGGVAVTDAFWRWDGSRWAAVKTATTPQARARAAMAWLPEIGLLMVGGDNELGAPIQEAWLFEGGDWYPLSVQSNEPVQLARSDLVALAPGGGEQAVLLSPSGIFHVSLGFDGSVTLTKAQLSGGAVDFMGPYPSATVVEDAAWIYGDTTGNGQTTYQLQEAEFHEIGLTANTDYPQLTYLPPLGVVFFEEQSGEIFATPANDASLDTVPFHDARGFLGALDYMPPAVEVDLDRDVLVVHDAVGATSELTTGRRAIIARFDLTDALVPGEALMIDVTARAGIADLSLDVPEAELLLHTDAGWEPIARQSGGDRFIAGSAALRRAWADDAVYVAVVTQTPFGIARTTDLEVTLRYRLP